MSEEREEALRARIAEDPYDVKAWEALVTVVFSRDPSEQGLADQRAVLEELLTQFPTAVLYWQRYAELELDEDDTARAKIVFSRCLLSCPNVKLWNIYLRFIKKMNEAKGAEGMNEVRKSYEYTLERIGTDSGSGSLWLEYINFLQGPRPGTPAYQALFSGGLPGQEDAQRQTLLRRAYHKALTVPGKHLEQVWRLYEVFERSSSDPVFAKRMLDSKRHGYNASKSAAAEIARLQAPLNSNALALPPGKGGWAQQEQERHWKELIAWEKSNPMRLDGPAFAQRVGVTYEQALMYLMHYPEVWYGHSRWHSMEGGGGAAVAASVLHRARQTLSDCTMLHLAAADLEEGRGELDAARAVYEEQVEALQPTLDSSGAPSTSGSMPDAEKMAGSLKWVQYMRFARRAFDVPNSRKVFLRARRWPGCTWQVFVAAAYMEYAGDGNDKVARNIFELGLEKFLGTPAYILRYVEFLEGLADTHNTRALFERALAETLPEASQPLWDRYIQFQQINGDLASVTALEQRRRESIAAGPNDDIDLLLTKYRLYDIWPCSSVQKVHLQRLLGERPLFAEGGGLQSSTQPDSAVLDAAGPGKARPSAPASPRVLPSPLRGPTGEQTPPYQGDSVRQWVKSEPGGPAQANAPLQMPPALGAFYRTLPPPQGIEPPLASVDTVVDLLLKTDLSPAAAAAAEVAANGPPSASHPAPVSLQPPPGWEPKRKLEDAQGQQEGPDNAAAFDVFRARARQRAKHTA